MSNTLKITFDTSGFDKLLDKIESNVDKFSMRALEMMGDELLRISASEVPHDTGALQASGSVQVEKDSVIVGYHTPYAARLHEHPEYKFQGGRKGKFLEDPLKHNLGKWLDTFGQGMGGLI